MKASKWSDEHSRAISDAAGIEEPVSQREMDVTWHLIHEEISAAEARPRRRRMRAFLIMGVAAGVLGAGGVAVATVYSAHTGRYAKDAEDLRLGGPGEHLDPAAPDYRAVIDLATRDVPFPTARDRDSFLSAEVRSDQRGAVPGETSVATGAVRFWAARAAVCAWANQWAAATSAGDTVGKSAAGRMLEEAHRWRAVTDLDPRQTIRYTPMEVTDPSTGTTTTQLFEDNTEAGYFPLLRTAAAADDLTGMGGVLAKWGACEAYGIAMSDFPQAKPQG